MSNFFSTEDFGFIVETFSFTHLLTIVFVALIPIALIYVFRKKLRKSKHRYSLFVLQAVIVIICELGLYIWSIKRGNTFIEYMPYELCGIVLYMQVYAILTKRFDIFKITYFYMFGPILSVVALDTPFGINRFRYWDYMVVHLLHIVSFSYAYYVYEIKITIKEYFKALKLLLGLGIGASIIDLTFNVNNMFILKPAINGIPILDVPYSINPWLYSLVWIIIVLFLTFLLYLLPPVTKKDIN